MIKGIYPWGFLLCGVLNLGGAIINNKLYDGGLELMSSEYGCWPITYLVAFAGILATLIFSFKYTNRYIMYLGRNSIIYLGLHQTVVMPIMNNIYEKFNVFKYILNESVVVVLKSIITLIVIIVTLTAFNEFIKRTKLTIFIGKS